MALNITFTCNTVQDENGNAINCKYQVYYPEHNLWNNVRDTQLFQYNCNAGDGDSLTQTGSFLSGQHAIVALWVGGNDRTGLKDRMAYHVITHDGVTSTYVIDVQLRPKMAPSCNWYLNTTATINREKTAYSYADDDYSYVFNGTTHYHHRKYGSEVIFDSIDSHDMLDITFDFGEGDGYATTDKHTYIGIGDFTAHHKAINQYSLQSICDRDIRLKYNTPIGCLSFSPDGYGSGDEVQKGDTVTTTACITDEDSRITDIEHHWIIKDRDDNSTIIRDTKVANNTILDYSYDKELLELQDTFGYQYISWNDGWEDHTITKYREIQVKNITPEVTISKLDLSSKEKRFEQISTDDDGSITTWSWKIYLLMPFSAEWVEVYNTTSDGSPIQIVFNEAGKYKAEITVEDDYKKYSTTNSTYAGFASDEIVFDISASGTCTSSGMLQEDVFFIFPDVVGDGINIS